MCSTSKGEPVGRKVSKEVGKLNIAKSEPYNQSRVQPWVVKGYINKDLGTSTRGDIDTVREI